jgi:hypothetical protein
MTTSAEIPVYHIPVARRRDRNGVIRCASDAEIAAIVRTWRAMLDARHPADPFVVIGAKNTYHITAKTVTRTEPTPEGLYRPSALSDWGLCPRPEEGGGGS